MYVTKYGQGCQVMLDKKEADALYDLLHEVDPYFTPRGSFEYEFVCDLQDALEELVEDE